MNKALSLKATRHVLSHCATPSIGESCVAGGGACMARGHVWRGGMHGRGRAWQGGVHGKGAWVVGGVRGKGGVHDTGDVWGGGERAWQERWPLLRTVRILLECILVLFDF